MSLLQFIIFHLFSLGLGKGSNNWAELTALTVLLKIAIEKRVDYLQVYGDSKIINGQSSLQNVGLQAVMEQISDMRNRYHIVFVAHIFREQNSKADSLSKARTTLEARMINIQEEKGVILITPPFHFLQALSIVFSLMSLMASLSFLVTKLLYRVYWLFG